MKKFEYKIYRADPFKVELNVFGCDGWELVGFVVIPYDNNREYVFKRELKNEQD